MEVIKIAKIYPSDTQKETQKNATKKPQPNPNSSKGPEELDMDDITSNEESSWINLGVGKTVSLEVAKVMKVPDPKFSLSKREYKIVIVDKDGEKLSVTAWVLWNTLKAAFRAVKEQEGKETPKGIKLRLNHPAEEQYEIEWSLDGSIWHDVEQVETQQQQE